MRRSTSSPAAYRHSIAAQHDTCHTTEELTAWARYHLRHEVVQLAAMAVTLSVDNLVLTPQRSATWVGNALLESFLLHARTVADFLRNHHDNPKDRRADDVLAVDYLPSWQPRDALSRDDRRGINKQLAHLSIKRLPGSERPWHFAAIASRLLAGMGTFLAEFLDAPSEARRITDDVALQIGWQQAMDTLKAYGLLDDARSPRDGGTSNFSSTTS